MGKFFNKHTVDGMKYTFVLDLGHGPEQHIFSLTAPSLMKAYVLVKEEYGDEVTIVSCEGVPDHELDAVEKTLKGETPKSKALATVPESAPLLAGEVPFLGVHITNDWS